MISLRKAQDRGHFNHGLLDTSHTFSFADYYDPGQWGFSVLRMINEDIVAPGKALPPQGHRDSVNGQTLTAGDGARISDETEIRLTGRQDAGALLFDLP
jgi:redox-sensitive bicupin YhaK (pirin superfamily)